MRIHQIIKHLERRITLIGRPRPIDFEIEEVLIGLGRVTPADAADKLESLTSRAKRLIQDREANAEGADDQPVLRIVGEAETQVCGFCYVVDTDDEQYAAALIRRAQAPTMEDRIVALSFSEFERFGARVLTALGARTGRVTAHSNDQGIDFYGEFNFGQLIDVPAPFASLAKGVSLLFAGQAKHYTDKIGPAVVREIVGAMMLARTKTHSKDGVDIFKNLNIRPFSPVVTLLFTTSTFTSGARHLADAAGIIAKDRKQLAAFLVDQGVAIEVTGATAIFNEAKFAEWLNEGSSVEIRDA